MIIYDWPAGLSVTSENWRIDARTRSGGETITGREQVTSSGLARWVANIVVPAYSPHTIRTLRALIAKLDGRENAVRVGPCDCINGPGGSGLITGIPYGDGSFHTDGTGFQQGGAGPAVAAAAGAGDVSVIIDVGSTLVPIPEGVYFGVGGRLHLLLGYTSLPYETAQLDFKPKLRGPLAEGDPVLWCRARVPMHLATDDAASLELQLARTGSVSFDFVEADY